MTNPTRKRETYSERYQGSPRQAGNDRISHAIFEALEPIVGNTEAFDWKMAWHDLLIKKGRSIGLPPKSKPPSRRDPDGRLGVLWEAWNHARGQHEAGRFGLVAHMSYGGSMGSLMFCRVAGALEAYNAAGDAIAAEYARQSKKSA